MDEARIIPLHRDPASTKQPATKQPATRQPATKAPGPKRRRAGAVDPGAEIYPFRPPEPTRSPVPPAPSGWQRRAADAMAFLRRRLAGDYGVDDYGFDRDLTETVVLPLVRPVYERWFRVEVNGTEHIPADGGALLVANHAGALWALDAVMTAFAVHEHRTGPDGAGRHLRMLGADLVFRTPGLGPLARRAGATLACAEDAERLLRSGELVGVWPEGFRGIGKNFRDRYRVQRFGHGGFAQAAFAAGVPIIPVAIVGSEEIHPMLGNARALGRLLNLPYFPLTPTFPWLGPLGLVPLPSKWYIEFGSPITTGTGAAADDPVAVLELSDRVRDSIQSALDRLLVQRRSVWR